MKDLTYAQALETIRERDAMLKNKAQRIRRLEVQLKTANAKSNPTATPEPVSVPDEPVEPIELSPEQEAIKVEKEYATKGLPVKLRHSIPTYATLELELKAQLGHMSKSSKVYLEDKKLADKTIRHLKHVIALRDKKDAERSDKLDAELKEELAREFSS